ncbi:2-oxoglutarate and iron-dependent oxygenase JMJD4 [Coccinella septempunctata]|uniref:2-oxoglutarate and iron-dependent oxygenase JMJD4 n=1 Tax=Coccinella septempunctata TaxID=41139 RepID=UPI001D06C191|nr:2-oxoglutarate and iron-dependent oxygenase JMJD4 [Coccinella septempunctata]
MKDSFANDLSDPNFQANSSDKDCGLNQDVVPVMKSPPYETFFQYHMMRNLPCLIQRVGREWKSTKAWCKNGVPNFEYLKNKYGESVITVYHCDEKFFDSHKTSTMKFKEYVDYWKEYSAAEDKKGMELLYLKDWHLKNEYKDDDFYEVPQYFSSDWLNEYLIANSKDDYRFVYMGPTGSWTPLHKDVMDTFSWSVNICGLKKWILFPPGQETHLINEFGQLPHSIEHLPKNIKYFIVMQHPGDALFVPSKWYHQVWNLADTISINHNWVNATNIHHMKSNILQGLMEIQKELQHLSSDENFHTECQKILKCHVGINCRDFNEFISFIASRRIQGYEKNLDNVHVKTMLVYELEQIQKVLTQGTSKEDEELEELRTQIESILNC